MGDLNLSMSRDTSMDTKNILKVIKHIFSNVRNALFDQRSPYHTISEWRDWGGRQINRHTHRWSLQLIDQTGLGAGSVKTIKNCIIGSTVGY